MKFIDSAEKILEVREVADYRISVVETDKPIEKVMKPGLFISGVKGHKIITEKIK